MATALELQQQVLQLQLNDAQKAIKKREADAQPNPNGLVGIRVGDVILRMPAASTQEQRQTAISEFYKTPTFNAMIDKNAGAPARVRAMVGSQHDPISRLATMRNFYPDAFEFDGDNFVFKDPATGRHTLYNPSGLDLGDVASVAKEGTQLVGTGLGATFGALSGLATGPGAPVAVPYATAIGAGAGNLLAGQAFDFLAETFGGAVEKRSATQQAIDATIDFGGGAIGQRGGELLERGAKIAFGAGKKTAQDLASSFSRFNITPTASAVSGSRALATVEATSEAIPTSSPIMQKQAQSIIKETEAAVEKLVSKIGTPKTDIGAGGTVTSAAEKAGARMTEKFGKIYDDVFEVVGDTTRVRVDSLRELRVNLQAQLKQSPASRKGELGPAIQQLDNIIADAGESGVPFGAFRAIRTSLGRNIKQPHLSGKDASGNALDKLIWGALTDDMKATARAVGPKVARKLSEADKSFSAWKTGAAKTLDKFLGFKSDEKAFKAILTSAKDDARSLQHLRKHFDADEWDTVVASTLQKMGMNGEKFDSNLFLRNWSKNISPEAKKILFANGRYGTMHKDLNELTKVMESLKGVDAVANRSNTFRAMVTYSLLSALGTGAGAAASGDVTGATLGLTGTILGGVVAPRTAARLVTSPRFIKWLSTPIAGPKGLGAHFGRLLAIGKGEPELRDAIREYVEVFRGGSSTADPGVAQ